MPDSATLVWNYSLLMLQYFRPKSPQRTQAPAETGLRLLIRLNLRGTLAENPLLAIGYWLLARNAGLWRRRLKVDSDG
jgi:hypothetical protein